MSSSELYNDITTYLLRVFIYSNRSPDPKNVVTDLESLYLDKLPSSLYKAKTVTDEADSIQKDFFDKLKKILEQGKKERRQFTGDDFVIKDNYREVFDKIEKATTKYLMLKNYLDPKCALSESDADKIYNYLEEHPNYMYDDEYKKAILKYRYCNYLTYDDKLRDGFFDCGRECEPSSYDDRSKIHTDYRNFITRFRINNIRPIREVLLVDESKDPKLREMVKEVKSFRDSLYKFLDRQPGLLDKIMYVYLADYVENVLGGSASDRELSEELVELYRKNRHNLVYIGEITKGVCRQKGILYKYLCDKIGLDCALVRGRLARYKVGGWHVWNLIEYDDDTHLIDVRNYQQDIIPMTDSRIDRSHYLRAGYKGTVKETHLGRSLLK